MKPKVCFLKRSKTDQLKKSQISKQTRKQSKMKEEDITIYPTEIKKIKGIIMNNFMLTNQTSQMKWKNSQKDTNTKTD